MRHTFIHTHPPHPPGRGEVVGFWRGFTVSSVILEEVRSVKVLLSLRQCGGGGETQSCCHDNPSPRMPCIPLHCSAVRFFLRLVFPG